MVLQSVSYLISLDSSISLHAISAYFQDHACINHAGTAVLSSQEFVFPPSADSLASSTCSFSHFVTASYLPCG